MPEYQITYHTRNEYTDFIHDAILEFLVFPATLQNQKVQDIYFEHEPKSMFYSGENMYGFEFLRFRIKNLEKFFAFTLKTTVTKDETNPFDFPLLTIKEEERVIASDEYRIDNYLFLSKGQLTQIPEKFKMPVKGKQENIFQFAKDINEFVHTEINYDNSIDNPHRLISETVSEKRGVCQDLAHLMIAILRKNKIPARYVSGYLNPGENAVGAGAVHAWVEVLIPGAGWLGFDPTNNLLEDHHYIKIAHGIDINDCTTLKGILKGHGYNRTDYHVLVEEQSKEMNQ